MPGLFTNPIFVGAGGSAPVGDLYIYGRAVALKRGYVAKPKSDRWHKRPTAMLGGVAIFAATAIAYLLFVPRTDASLVVMVGQHVPFSWSGSSMTFLASARIKN
jgi:UDP-N-acetylmuramyl pentapeptide phosphotransferase/UDP-N-acetylglucosamine-1-phosphate transferase